MNRIWKHKRTCSYLVILIIFITTFPLPSNAQESSLPVAPIIIDNVPINTKYMMRDGQIHVPAIFFKHTGAQVDWNEIYRSVVFQAKDKKVAFPVGKNYTDEYDRVTRSWNRGILSSETIEFQNEVFVPLMEVAKKLDMDISYDHKAKRTLISTNLYVKSNGMNKRATSRKLVALTFDDGPEDYYTPKILDILKEKGVLATFFVVGYEINSYPDMMKRIVNEGHGIGNHTTTHPDLRTKWSVDVRKEIVTTQEILLKTIGRKSDLFRPPFGAITKADIAILNEIGMRNILWSVDTLDWSGLSGREIVNIVLRDVSPGGIILQHNFQHERLLDGTVEALPVIIDELHEQGYTFVTVQTLLE
ncbi:polysaccharide deacetylase family protein [Evansella sp. AB-rgal1]|uniref:polysaccharide deacetylase family protein n=1 Tax=Evansella sp. AB-rgal1 TaxID=3242696 RepID=UPI00359D32CD